MKIGIDPGITGAIAILDNSLECVGLEDMPVMQLGMNHQQVNAPALAKILRHYATLDALDYDVYLEQVNAMPGQGVTSMFNFGMGYGMIIGICGAAGYSLRLVKPSVWKRTAGLIGHPKDAARTLAQQIYPGVDLSLKKHIGRADALLIARFGFLS